jgi:hypothetical protein
MAAITIGSLYVWRAVGADASGVGVVGSGLGADLGTAAWFIAATVDGSMVGVGDGTGLDAGDGVVWSTAVERVSALSH